MWQIAQCENKNSTDANFFPDLNYFPAKVGGYNHKLKLGFQRSKFRVQAHLKTIFFYAGVPNLTFELMTLGEIIIEKIPSILPLKGVQSCAILLPCLSTFLHFQVRVNVSPPPPPLPGKRIPVSQLDFDRCA